VKFARPRVFETPAHPPSTAAQHPDPIVTVIGLEFGSGDPRSADRYRERVRLARHGQLLIDSIKHARTAGDRRYLLVIVRSSS